MCRSSGDSVSATDGEEGQGRTVTNAITVLTVKAAVNGVQLMRVPVLINGVQIKLLVDTVAIVSLPSIQDYQKPFSNVKLLQSHLTIHNHSQQALQLAIIGETLSCTVIQPDPRRVQKSVHRRNLQAGHEDSAKIQQRSFRLPKEVTDDLAWLEEVGLLKKVSRRSRDSNPRPLVQAEDPGAMTGTSLSALGNSYVALVVALA
ncbi:hypothetical protein HPB51_020550 [Rhipicephalus microplus]|uniref:Uncharacterized protein n=1 Tax=Rhipicephalus microplus TaxID=6941 RepID=A0A9J6D717_RHIMP|nr:hypothetical protein HPB51_020550 [Rhipicephalus microplus]